MKIIETEAIPIKMWLDEMESGAMEQTIHLANLPFAFHHVAIMPDAHQGYGMPIGGVLATKGMIVPNAVGVDIGCGVYAVRTSVREIDGEKLRMIVSLIRQLIPLGFLHHKRKQDSSLMPSSDLYLPIVEREYENALSQIGTLGGGNHFIEIQKGSDGFIWIMIHSGSRNIGLKVAEHYNRLAKQMLQKKDVGVPSSWQLSPLSLDSETGQIYFGEMNYCREFAWANRSLMMERVKEAFNVAMSGGVSFDRMIHIAHNYASMENHYGEDVIVHRKGATSARKEELGIVPGSQGASSYIVKGLGNEESFESCSHGAGRKMGRKAAIRSLDMKEEVAKLEKRHILHSIRKQKDLDEAAGAYKDIETVMKNQADLVEIETKLEPLAVVKG